MAIEKITVVARVDVLEDNIINITEEQRFLEDGEIISSKKSTRQLQPNSDISGECDKVKAIAAVAWS